MAFELRGGRKYYYRSRRVDGRGIKQYLGRGPAAKQAAAEVAQRKLDRLEQCRRDRRFENQLLLLRDEFEQYWQASERAWRLALWALNYHNRRGEWRRCRKCRTSS